MSSLRSLIAPLALSVLALSVNSALAQPSPVTEQGSGVPVSARAAGGGEPVSLSFQNAEIAPVIQTIGKLSGVNFLIDPRVKGTLNIVTNTPVAPELAYQILLSALRLQGYAAVEGNGVTKIVPEADAKLHAVPVATGSKRPAGDRLVTQVFALRHESAAQMLSVVRPLVAPNNTVTAYPSNNILVVTDYAENVGRIAAVIDSLDVLQGDLTVIELRHAIAADVAPLITRLLAERAGSAAGTTTGYNVQVLAEPRSNSLVVRADSPSRIAAVRQLVASLDRPGGGGNIHVVYLKNAEAEQVADTLNGILNASPAGGYTPASTASNAGGFTQTSATAGSTEAMTTTGATATTSASSAQSGIIRADSANNALLINAPEAVYRNLRQVIDQLDRRRAQVYIEALIAEVSAERAAEFGIQWAAGGTNGSTSAIGGTAFSSGGNNLLQLIGSTATTSTTGNLNLPGNGLTLAIGGGKVSIPGVGDILSLGLLARFLENEVRANILSTPNVITLDNEEAKIVVGRNVPFVTGQYTNTGAGSGVANPFQTIERKDVGLTLRVRPQISEGGAIRLAIYQEASAILDSTDKGSGPSTTKRSIESMVMVDDGAIIALGGLVEDEYSGSEEKVPVLGDVPLAGQLFRYDGRKRRKTNLVVFLRPVILRDRADYDGITRSRYDYVIGEQQRSAQPRDLMRGEPVPARLPAFDSPAPAVPLYAPVSEAQILQVTP